MEMVNFSRVGPHAAATWARAGNILAHCDEDNRIGWKHNCDDHFSTPLKYACDPQSDPKTEVAKDLSDPLSDL